MWLSTTQVSEVYHPTIRFLYLNYDGVEFAALVALFVIVLYSGSILIDQVRIVLWLKLSALWR